MVSDRQCHLPCFLSVLLALTQTASLCAQPLFHAQTPKLDRRVVPSPGNKLQARVAVSIVKPKEVTPKKDDLKANKEKDGAEQPTSSASPSTKSAKIQPADTQSKSTPPNALPPDKRALVPVEGKTAGASEQTPSVLACNVDNAAMRALTASAQNQMRQAQAAEPNLTAGTSFNFARMFGWLNAQADNHHQRLNAHSQSFKGMTYEELVTTYGITGLLISGDAKHHQQVIKYVFPTTPASAAGIRPGDVLLMANDHLFYGDEGQVETWRVITGPPHTKVDMVISRNGAKYKVTLARMNIEDIRDPHAKFYFQRCFRRLGALNTTGN